MLRASSFCGHCRGKNEKEEVEEDEKGEDRLIVVHPKDLLT